MGRNAHFTSEEFISTAIALIAEQGPAALTIAALSDRINAPVGSVYHRFASRDELLAELWLKIVESFQSEFLKILEADGLQAALFELDWVRAHPQEGRILLLYRREDLSSGKWPDDMQKRALRLTDELNEGIRRFAKKQFGRITKENIDRAVYAVFDAPVGAIRRYLLNNKVPPESIKELIRETYEAIIKNENANKRRDN
jgi:AcrR family transcriptional regulator